MGEIKWLKYNTKKKFDNSLLKCLPLDAASSASLYNPRKNREQARWTHTSAGHSGFRDRDLYSCQNMIRKSYEFNSYVVHPVAHTHSETDIFKKKYLHSPFVVTQVKSTVANPEICMLLFLSNISLKLEGTVVTITFHFSQAVNYP